MRISDWSSDVCSSDLKAAEKSWRRTLREDERGEAGLRSDRANRGRGWSARFRKSWEYGKWRPFCAALGTGTLRRSPWLRPIHPDLQGHFVCCEWAFEAGTVDRKSTRLTPVTNAHLVCRLLLEKKNNNHVCHEQ